MLQITHVHACWFLCTREAQVGSRVRGERERERERERVWHGDPNTIIVCNKKTSFLWWPGPLGFIPCWMKMLKMVLYPIHD